MKSQNYEAVHTNIINSKYCWKTISEDKVHHVAEISKYNSLNDHNNTQT